MPESAMRTEMLRLLRQTPFRPFLIIMDSGMRIAIRHLENVALDPEVETANCYALADGVMHILPWTKIAHLAFADSGQPGQPLPQNGEKVS